MKKLTLENLDELAIGSAILGSGGGGDPTYTYMMARHEIEKRGPVSLISIEELDPDEYILPVGLIGAPLVEKERIQSGNEYNVLFERIEHDLGKKIRVVVAFEIGGSSAFIPIMVGARLGIPVLDGDMMGRAFPEAQMSSCNLMGANPSPGAVVDCLNNSIVIKAANSNTLEKIGRQVSVAMGSSAAFGFYPMTGKAARDCAIPKSVSKALSIGKAHREAKVKGKDPLEAILNVCKGIWIGSGKITDIDRFISKAFLNGTVVIQNKDERMELFFQNEYLLAKYNNEVIASTPDLLVLLEQDTGSPITSETLQFGLKVNLIVLPAPSLWTSKEGLSLVGPRYFGYEVDYQPISKTIKKAV
jgi:uncharacterized protein